MKKELNLFEILKDVPKGTKLYSPLYGEVTFDEFIKSYKVVTVRDSEGINRPIYYNGTHYGMSRYPDSECMLFPSKDQRDWSKFEAPKQKVKVTLHPFDKVLVRDANTIWLCTILSHIDMDHTFPFVTSAGYRSYCLPYNKQTKHLVGTADKCPIEYEIEFEK